MYCTKCGTELPDGSNFCSACGTNLQAINNTPNVSGMCKFSIERKKAFGGMVAKIKLYLDGSLAKELSNGEKFSTELKNGKHILYCQAFGMNRTPSFEFTGDSNEISYYVQFPSALQAMTLVNTTGQTLILNKINETEPGSYKI